MTDPNSTRSFTQTLFSHITSGVLEVGLIEIRLIEDRKGGAVVEREWYASVDALIDDLPRLLALAQKRNAAIFYGVLPRFRRAGTSADATTGLVVWSDMDFKDFAGGEAEARNRLASFPLKPSIIVKSGHGVHVFWLLREPTDPAELSGLSKRIARHVGGDHTFDAARILRLPGSFNRKDPRNPILVEVELFQPERTYNASEISDALDVVGAPKSEEKSESNSGERIQIAGALSEHVRRILDSNSKVQKLFEGRGKKETGPDGRKRDTSTSGYDFSFLLALLAAGIADRSELATALWFRPDGVAQEKGLDYITRTVDNAIRDHGAHRDEEGPPPWENFDFQVEAVRVYASNPPVYQIWIRGVAIKLTSGQLSDHGTFRLAYMNAFHRLPLTPCEKGEWPSVVNHWLDSAEKIEQPPEASRDPALREAIVALLDELTPGEDASDLDRGKGVEVAPGLIAFKVKTLLDKLRHDFPEIRSDAICAHLRELKCDHGPQRLGDRVVKAWVWKRVTA